MTGNYRQQQETLVNTIRSTVTNAPSMAKKVGSASTVGMRADYAMDDRLCLTSLAFVPRLLGQHIESMISGPLRQVDPNQYYYPLESLHLTIKNVRTVDVGFADDERERALKVFATILPRHPVIDFSLEELLMLPTSLSLIGYTDERFRDLVVDLDQALKAADVADNKRYYSDDVWFGNVTVCRFTTEPTEDFRNAIQTLGTPYLGTMTVSTVSLVACNAVCASASRQVVAEYHLGTTR